MEKTLYASRPRLARGHFRAFLRRAPRPSVLLLLILAILCAPATSLSSASLADLSLEELLNVTVTTVSKKEQNLHDAAAAAFVLTNEDIQRSGAASPAEALRLAPGLNVAAINSSDWAVTARGFNDQFANKMLVMIGKLAWRF